MAVALNGRGRATSLLLCSLCTSALLLTGFDAGAQVADAIRRNVLLGSSAIGIAAAFGLAVGARKIEDIGFEEVRAGSPA